MLKLFYAPGTCALASHIVLEEIGEPYEAHRLNFRVNEQRTPEYLSVNPKGRVPALITDQGVISETPAILVYLAQTHPEANLAPVGDPFAFAQLQSFCSYLASTVHVAHAHMYRGARWSDDPAAWESMKRKVPQSVGEAFALIEDGMLAGPWVMGEAYTIADPYLFTVSNWLEGDGVDVGRLPRVLDHRKRMGERPAVQRALAQEAAS